MNCIGDRDNISFKTPQTEGAASIEFASNITTLTNDCALEFQIYWLKLDWMTLWVENDLHKLWDYKMVVRHQLIEVLNNHLMSDWMIHLAL